MDPGLYIGTKTDNIYNYIHTHTHTHTHTYIYLNLIRCTALPTPTQNSIPFLKVMYGKFNNLWDSVLLRSGKGTLY